MIRRWWQAAKGIPSVTSSSGPAAIRIVIAEDQELVRRGAALLISMEPDMEVVGEATNGHEAIALANELKPDLVLMDVSMPGLNGIEATAEIKNQLPQTKVLMLTMHENEEYLFRTIKAGGSGYVLKRQADSELLDAIHQVMEGGAFLRPSVATALVQDYLERVEAGEEQTSYERLTEREREVMAGLARGKLNKQIAAELHISERTVKAHRHRVMEKMHATSFAELVLMAERLGLIVE